MPGRTPDMSASAAAAMCAVLREVGCVVDDAGLAALFGASASMAGKRKGRSASFDPGSGSGDNVIDGPYVGLMPKGTALPAAFAAHAKLDEIRGAMDLS